MLHGRTRPQSGQGPGRFPARHARQESTSESRPRSGRREIRLGPAAAGAHRSRRLCPAVVRQFHCDRGRGGGRRHGRGPSAPRHFGGRYRHRGQSRYDHGAAARRPDFRAYGCALRRSHHRQGARPAIQFQRLPHATHRSGPQHRGARDQERRGSGRHRRDRLHGRPAGIAQCDLRRDRRRAAPAADRSPRARGQGVSVMRARITIVILIVLIAAAVFTLKAFTKGPLAFAGGHTVALADYHEANPTGVPQNLAKADPVKRGEYLARAADCMVCHTAPGGAAYAGGLGIPLPFGTIYTTNITPDKDTGIGSYSDQEFLDALRRGIRRDGTRLYPAMPYTSYTYMTDADGLAIKAYLFSLPAVHRAAPGDTFAFPFSQRWLMVFW